MGKSQNRKYLQVLGKLKLNVVAREKGISCVADQGLQLPTAFSWQNVNFTC